MPVTNTQVWRNARATMRFTTKDTMGDEYFVNSNTTGACIGTAAGGYNPDSPSLTLIQAQTLATASQGDIVYVFPTHAETASAAAAMTFSKAGVRYQGIGQGRMRPKITFDTIISAQIIVSGANITFSNMIFDFTGFDAITACISVTGADVAFEDCEFICQNATISPVLGILTAATATRFRVERCRFIGVKTSSTAATCLGFIQHEVGEDFLIKDCHFEGKATQLFKNATAILDGLITNCTFHTYTGVLGLTAHASSQFWVNNCSFCVASGAAPVVGTKVNVTKNAYTTEGVGIVAGTVTQW